MCVLFPTAKKTLPDMTDNPADNILSVGELVLQVGLPLRLSGKSKLDYNGAYNQAKA
jgi:hypothetical protein